MSALLLRMIACCAMLVDHIGFELGYMPLRAVGRIAFPIFVYLIYNGYRHTSSRPKYALRLAVFAILSQIPFSLFCTGTATDLNGSVFVTLLIALLCVWAADVLLGHKLGRWLFWLPGALCCVLYQLGLLKSDYGARAIVLVMTFLLFDGKTLWKRGLTVLGCLCSVFYQPIVSCAWQLMRGGGLHLPTLSQWEWMQLFSLCALPFIFLYNGQEGLVPKNKAAAKLMQYGFYLFYPVHMLILWLIRTS